MYVPLTALIKRENQHTSFTVFRYIKELKIPLSFSSFTGSLETHPDYPSLLSITESLKKWKIDSLAIKIEPEKLDDLPTPFLAYINDDETNLVLITSVNGAIEFKEQFGKKRISRSEFLKKWNNVVLLAEKTEQSGEPEYRKKRTTEIIRALPYPAILVCCLLLTALSFILSDSSSKPFIFFLLIVKLVGCFLTSLLLGFETNQSNTFLKQFCAAGKSSNCSAILNSTNAKIFNFISWSEIGFFYFTGGFILLLLSSFNTAINLQASYGLLSWLNLFALPFTFFSIFYQWRIAKKWCTLCLAVQAVLVTEFIIIFFGYWLTGYSFVFNSNIFLLSLLCFLLPVFFWMIAKPLFLQAQQANNYKKENLKLKYNKEIFNALLSKQKPLSVAPLNLGIRLGSPQAKHTIITVCNPYCSPCAKAHSLLDKILENNDVKLQIIFTASNDETDRRTLPVKHLMALYANADSTFMRNAINDWYISGSKDYKAFAAKYIVAGAFLKDQENTIEKMSQWCKEMEITFTPTVFVNGYQLPDVYTIEDLSYLLD